MANPPPTTAHRLGDVAVLGLAVLQLLVKVPVGAFPRNDGGAKRMASGGHRNPATWRGAKNGGKMLGRTSSLLRKPHPLPFVTCAPSPRCLCIGGACAREGVVSCVGVLRDGRGKNGPGLRPPHTPSRCGAALCGDGDMCLAEGSLRNSTGGDRWAHSLQRVCRSFAYTKFGLN